MTWFLILCLVLVEEVHLVGRVGLAYALISSVTFYLDMG